MTTGRLSFILVLCVGAVALAAPELSVSEPLWDFGAVASGSVLTHAFVLRNGGADPLVIEKVTTSCGCTTAPLATPYALGPGETVELAVTLHVSGSGSVSRTVTITSNDPASPFHLTVKASASAVPAMSPAELAEDFYLLIDIRAPSEYASGHIPGGIGLPYSDLPFWATTLPADAVTLLYDEDGTTAAAAAEALRAAGVPQAFPLDGGYARWSALYPMLTTTIGPTSQIFVAAAAPATTASGEAIQVSPEALRGILMVLIDLRDPETFARGHLAGALNVQEEELASFCSGLPSDLDLVLYGEADEASVPARTLFQNSGMTKVTSLTGGLSGWKASYGDLFVMQSL